MFLLEIRTILIFFGLTFDLIGALLLAFEIIGLKKIKDYNLMVQNSIESINAKFLYGAIWVILSRILGLEVSKKKILWLYIQYSISGTVLSFLEKLTRKLGTDQGVVTLGAFLLIIGYLFQVFALL